jgi:hypothetical protein
LGNIAQKAPQDGNLPCPNVNIREKDIIGQRLGNWPSLWGKRRGQVDTKQFCEFVSLVGTRCHDQHWPMPAEGESREQWDTRCRWHILTVRPYFAGTGL